MAACLIVFLGAGLGGVLRHGVNVAALKLAGAQFPWGTLAVNVLGSVVTGLLAALFMARGGALENWRLFLITGVLGGFTTFSAFSLDAWILLERQQWGPAVLYIATSVLLSLGGLALGLWLTRTMILSN